jgi:Bax protein
MTMNEGRGFGRNPENGGGGRPESWTALFVLGFAAGVGAILAVAMLGSASLTDGLRSSRADAAPTPVATISLDLLPTDLDRPPPDIGADPVLPLPAGREDRLQPGTAAAPLEGLTVAALESEFAALEFDLAAVRARSVPVPRVVPDAVPADLDAIQNVERRKALFFKMVLPLVLIANERLQADRARILALHSAAGDGIQPSGADAVWLADQFARYRVEPGDWETLLRRVDVVPPSLALAQAAIESGWGTSRFAREGNALFGQWVWGEEADGIVPEERIDGMTHKIRAFDTPLAAVKAYIENLNRHRAYRDFREIRASLRRQGAGMNGLTLAEGLEAYSEKGRAYIDLVREIISVNELRAFDSVRLRGERA